MEFGWESNTKAAVESAKLEVGKGWKIPGQTNYMGLLKVSLVDCVCVCVCQSHCLVNLA